MNKTELNFWQWFLNTPEGKKYEELKEDREKHVKTHLKNEDYVHTALGSNEFCIVFTPTGIGVTCTLMCNYCDTTWELTDFSDW